MVELTRPEVLKTVDYRPYYYYQAPCHYDQAGNRIAECRDLARVIRKAPDLQTAIFAFDNIIEPTVIRIGRRGEEYRLLRSWASVPPDVAVGAVVDIHSFYGAQSVLSTEVSRFLRRVNERGDLLTLSRLFRTETLIERRLLREQLIIWPRVWQEVDNLLTYVEFVKLNFPSGLPAGAWEMFASEKRRSLKSNLPVFDDSALEGESFRFLYGMGL